MPEKPEVNESDRLAATLANGSEDYRTSYSLDMIAAIADGVHPDPGGLLALWEDVSVAQLPRTVRAFALSQTPLTPHALLTALLEPSVIAEGCADLIDVARRLITEQFGARSAEVSLLRAGLLTESVPTLETIGRQLEVTRERVRQLEKHAEGIVEEAKLSKVRENVPRSPRDVRRHGYRVAQRQGAAQKFTDQVVCRPLAHSLRAWFDLNPRRPLTDKEITVLAGGAACARCCERVLEILQYPSLSWSGTLWFRTEEQRRACEAVLAADKSWTGATSWLEVAARMRGEVPGVEHVLDLEPTLRLLGEMRDFGVGLDGRIVRDHSRLARRVARKIVTYLKARATPVPVDELARAISVGQIPFHVFQRPPITVSWLRECVPSADGLLIQKDGCITLAPSLAGRSPTGMVGILYSIVVRHGEPIRMQDLCDRASAFGLGRNQTGSLIHSRRAACLFMLSRGIVGLVGRDEGANADEYDAAKPARVRNTIRPGHEIGCDEDGALVADIQVRRSIREQGLGLPWPFSLALLDAGSQLVLDGERVAIGRKPNGDLDIPQLTPGATVRIALSRGRRGCILSINTKRRSRFDPIHLKRPGAPFSLQIPQRQGRPGWVAEFERQHDGEPFTSLDELFSALPEALTERRRVNALHGFIALGIVNRTSRGWKVVEGQTLPASIAAAFKFVGHDRRAYPALLGDDRAAVAWLVRAAWLTPNLGWSSVRHNDLSRDIELDPLLSDAGAPRSVGIREAALMRVVEAAEQAADWLVHPGEHDPLDQTAFFARRYLTALGYTGYRAVREVARTESGASITYALSAEGAPSAPPLICGQAFACATG